MLQYEIPDLHSAITLYVNHGNSGARPHRDDYQRPQLPSMFERLNIWTHLHFARPRLNEFYPNELRILRCKSSKTTGRLTFDPILVELSSRTGPSKSALNPMTNLYAV